jgi:hypothetical protein
MTPPSQPLDREPAKTRSRRTRRRGVRGWYERKTATERGAIQNGIIVGVIGAVSIFVVAIAQGEIIDFQDVLHLGDQADNGAPRAAVAPTPATPQNRRSNGLEVVEFSANDAVVDQRPVLDIKLRNVSPEVAFIKRVEIQVDRIWEVVWPVGCGPGVAPSGTYDLQLRLSGAPYTAPVEVSQGVPANGVDRFTLVLETDVQPTCAEEFVFLASASIVYDEDDKRVTSRPLLFSIGAQPKLPPESARSPFLGYAVAVWRQTQQVDANHSPRALSILEALKGM